MEEKSLPASVGEKIAALRKERGLTQKQLAEKIYTSDKNLSKWETGKALPDLGFLLALCREFNVKTDYFTDENFSAADLFNAQRQKEIKRRFGVWTSVIAAIAGIPLFILAAARAYLPSPRHAGGLNAQETLLRDVEGVFAGRYVERAPGTQV